MKYEGDFKELIYTQHKEEVFKIMVRFAVLEGIRCVLEHISCGHVERLQAWKEFSRVVLSPPVPNLHVST